MESYIIIAIGNILLTSAYAFLTVPNDIIDGGITSTSLLLSNVLNLDITYITTTITVLLLIFGLITLGKHFFIKSIFSSLCYILFFNTFHLTGFFITINPFLCIIIASILIGLGHYLCLSQNTTTVGYDVIALYFHKKKKYNTAMTLRIIGTFILILGIAIFGIQAFLYGIIFITIETQVIYLLNKYKFLKRKNKRRTIWKNILSK